MTMTPEEKQAEMRRLFDIGLKAANETLALMGPGIPPLDQHAPGVASLFTGVAAMIVESKK